MIKTAGPLGENQRNLFTRHVYKITAELGNTTEPHVVLNGFMSFNQYMMMTRRYIYSAAIRQIVQFFFLALRAIYCAFRLFNPPPNAFRLVLYAIFSFFPSLLFTFFPCSSIFSSAAMAISQNKAPLFTMQECAVSGWVKDKEIHREASSF